MDLTPEPRTRYGQTTYENIRGEPHAHVEAIGTTNGQVERELEAFKSRVRGGLAKPESPTITH